MALQDIFEDLLGDDYGKILGGGAAAGLLAKAYGDIGDIGRQGLRLGQELAETQLGQTQFLPYTVTSAMGGQFGTQVDPTTGQLSTTMQLSDPEQQFAQSQFGMAGDLFGRAFQDPTARTGAIYDRMLTAMRPEMQRQQLMNEERLAAQGRLGVRSNLFGGTTPEDFQLSRAQQEAMNNAYLSAMNQSMAEQQQQAGLAGQFLGSSYMPQQQLIAALQPGMTSAAQQQQARQFGAGLFGEATASGINALLGAAQGRANMLGAAGSGLLGGLAGGE